MKVALRSTRMSIALLTGLTGENKSPLAGAAI